MQKHTLVKLILLSIIANYGLMPGARAFEVTQQDSAEIDWIFSDQPQYVSQNACWSACFTAKNNAIFQMDVAAAAMCPVGYDVTRSAECNWPGEDPSYLDWNTDVGWVTCKCSVSCSGEFDCNTGGQRPTFHENVAEAWREFLQVWAIHYDAINVSHGDMQKSATSDSIYATVLKHAGRQGVNARPFMERYEVGEVGDIHVPTVDSLVDQMTEISTKTGRMLIKEIKTGAVDKK